MNREHNDADLTAPHWPASALLTIDVQRDFLSGRPYGVAGTSETLPELHALATAYRKAGLPIVHVVRLYLADGSNADISRRDLLRSGAVVARPGTAGAELADGLAPPGTELDAAALLRGEVQQVGPNEHVMFKPRWNAFFETPLDAWLRGREVDTVVVAGCNFPNCPRGTLFGASERDYRAVAVSDAISQWTPSAQAELDGLGIRSVATADVVAAVGRARRLPR